MGKEMSRTTTKHQSNLFCSVLLDSLARARDLTSFIAISTQITISIKTWTHSSTILPIILEYLHQTYFPSNKYISSAHPTILASHPKRAMCERHILSKRVRCSIGARLFCSELINALLFFLMRRFITTRATTMTSDDSKTFIVTLKENCSIDKFKDSIKGLGGEIQHEYNLIKGFSVKMPSIHASKLHSTEGINTIEEDQVVKANSV